jgi:hypothetical protein
VATRLSRHDSLIDQLRPLDGDDPLAALSILQAVFREAQRFAPSPVPIADLEGVLRAAREEVGELTAAVIGDRGRDFVDEVGALSAEWRQRKEELEGLRRAKGKWSSETSKWVAMAGEVGTLLGAPAPVEPGELARAVRRLVDERDVAARSLREWVSAPQLALDGMAAELGERLAGVERSLAVEEQSEGRQTWHQRLLLRLQEAAALEARLVEVRLASAMYLGLGPTADPSAVLQRELTRPHRVLRLTLLAALGCLRSAVEWPAERQLLTTLRLPEITVGAKGFLAALDGWDGNEELWEHGVSAAFSDRWLHDLLRAGLVLDTYYAATETGRRFAPVRALAEAFRGCAEAIGKPVLAVELLAERRSGCTEAREISGLVDLDGVRERVQARASQATDFVVDVERFAVPGETWFKECRVFVYNPAHWHATQKGTA